MKYTNKKRADVQKYIITQETAIDLFNECNKLFFNDSLQPIPIEIISDDKVHGDFKYELDFNKHTLKNFKIEISNNIARTKQFHMSTMIHEMLHYNIISNLSQKTIDEAIWYYENDNIDKFNILLYYENYAHTNKWMREADNINMLYGIKIHRN